RRAARLGLLLAPLNLWMLHNAWFTWPKMLAAYFDLQGLACYLQFRHLRNAQPEQADRYSLYFWIFMCLGYLTHQVALVYLLPLMVHWLIVSLRAGKVAFVVKRLMVLALTGTLIVGPWYLWL